MDDDVPACRMNALRILMWNDLMVHLCLQTLQDFTPACRASFRHGANTNRVQSKGKCVSLGRRQSRLPPIFSNFSQNSFNDPGLSGIIPFEVSIIRNEWISLRANYLFEHD